jgi:hypothetical protein
MHPTDEAVTGALAPLAGMLAADDFHLAITRRGEAEITLTVSAGPAACPTCLVPKDITRRMAEQHLRSLEHREWDVEIGYPTDESR